MHRERNIILFLLIFACIACKGSEKPKTQASQSADANTDIPCTAKDCPPLQLLIQSGPIKGTSLYGQAGMPTLWEFKGDADRGSSRDVRIKAFSPPPNARFTGQNSKKVSLSFQRNEPVKSQTPIKLVIRDISRCKFLYPQAGPDCENLDKKAAAGADFEREQEVAWEIGDIDIEQFIDPSFTGQQDKVVGANGGITGCLQAFMGALPQFFTGGIIGGVAGGAMGCIKDSLGNATK